MASIGLVRRIAMKRQQFRNNNRVIRAAVRDCEWLKMSLQLNRFAAMRLRLPPKQAMVRHLQTTKQEALFRALAGGRAAWLRFRKRALEAHQSLSARRQRLLSRRGNGGSRNGADRFASTAAAAGGFLRRGVGSALKPGSAAGAHGGGAGRVAAAEEATTFTEAWRRYGWLFVGTHFSVYFATLAGLTAAVKNGLLGRSEEEQRSAVEKVAALADDYLPARACEAIRASPTVGAFAVAWVTAKFTEPVRLVVTVFLTPRLHALRRLLLRRAPAAASSSTSARTNWGASVQPRVQP